MAHTILMSRGDKNYRCKVKTMQDGEIFLEDKVKPSNAKDSRVHLWAQLGDPADPNNPGPIKITDWITRLIQNHINQYKGNGHLLNKYGEVSNEDLIELQDNSIDDGKERPHGATSTPIRNRISTYDNSGRLSTSDVAPIGLNVINKNHLNSEVAFLNKNIADNSNQLKSWIAWILGMDEDGNFTDVDGELVDSAVKNLDQLSEVIKALNNDPNAFNTLSNMIKEHTHDITQITAENITIGTTENIDKFETEAISNTLTGWIKTIGQKINGLIQMVSVKAIFLAAHPVGSLYETVASDESTVAQMNAKYPGSEWEVWGAGRVAAGILATDANFNIVNKIGGHTGIPQHVHGNTLTDPGHRHNTIGQLNDDNTTGMPNFTGNTYRVSGHNRQLSHTSSSGERNALMTTHNNTGVTLANANAGDPNSINNCMPYQVCYRYVRKK